MDTIVIDIDSLRPDHLGCYGYNLPTTPNIDRLADDGVLFDQAYVANSPCMPSRAGMISGRYGIHNGVVSHDFPGQRMSSPHNWGPGVGQDPWEESEKPNLLEYWTLPDDKAWFTLPEVFFHERITTTAISSFPRHPAKWFYHLWDQFIQPREPIGDDESLFTPRAEHVADLAIDFLDANCRTDFFLYTQFWDPHEPYNRSEEEIEQFRDESLLPPYPTDEQIKQQQKKSVLRGATEVGIENRSDLAEIHANYDAEIRYADAHIGRIIDRLQAIGTYDESLIILTGDHGEEFGEHGVYRHHWSTFDGTQQIPLIIKPSKNCSFDPGCRDQLITNVDIAPTILEFAGIDPPEKWQGKSLLPIIEQQNDSWRDYIVLEHGLHTVQRAIRTSKWKLIRTYHPGMYKEELSRYQLYNLNEDPWEQNDISEEHQAIIDELERDMATWVEHHVGPDGDSLRELARDGPTAYHAFDDFF